MQWYYLSDTHERIAASEEQFPLLAARGVLRASTMIWRRGLAGWKPCGEVKPELFAAGVARDSDQKHPAADSLAVRGAVTGLAGTVAGYAPWLRIAGVLCLCCSLATMAGLVQAAWLAYDRGLAFLAGYLPWSVQIAEKGHTTAYVWGHFGMVLAGAFVLCALGVLLLRAASRAVRARESGQEMLLTGALHSVGVWFATGVVWVLLNLIFWLGLTIWLGWEMVWPEKEKPAPAPVVSV